MYWDIKQLTAHLKIKPCTLYAWTASGKIPHIKIHKLIRFRPEEIEAWLKALNQEKPKAPAPAGTGRSRHRDLDRLIATAREEAYNQPHGETRPISSPRKEGRDGVV